MSVNRKLTGSNGRMSLNSKSGKSNEASNESNSSLRKCKKKKPYFVWGFLGVVALGMVWFFISSHSDSFLLRKGKRLGDCEERARILLQRHNISKKQLHAFVSFFSVSDQVLCLCIFTPFLQETTLMLSLSFHFLNSLRLDRPKMTPFFGRCRFRLSFFPGAALRRSMLLFHNSVDSSPWKNC